MLRHRCGMVYGRLCAAVRKKSIHEATERTAPGGLSDPRARISSRLSLDCGSPAAAFPLHSLLWRLFLKFQRSILSSRLLRSKRQQSCRSPGNSGLHGRKSFPAERTYKEDTTDIPDTSLCSRSRGWLELRWQTSRSDNLDEVRVMHELPVWFDERPCLHR